MYTLVEVLCDSHIYNSRTPQLLSSLQEMESQASLG